ncbi:uncharacterized protein TNCV_3202811 [Trichonephila clavipes]|nr:uncharacterized protein TNCV_3202811 [Trichonephila clavipes]
MHDAIRTRIEAYKFCLKSRDISFSIFAVPLPLVRPKLVGCPNSHHKLSLDILDWDNTVDRADQARSSFLVHGTTPNGGVDGWASRAAYVMGDASPNVLQPGSSLWLEKTQGLLLNVLPVPGWRPMKQLDVRVHFLRCGGVLDNWSVEDALCEPDLQINYISRIHWPQINSQHSQSGLIDKLLT